MMAMFLMIAYIFTMPAQHVNSATVDDLRRMFQVAPNGKSECQNLINYCDLHTSDPERNLVMGYKGCATMMMAKFSLNPYKKWSSFSSGKKMLEQSINQEPKNVELRYLRYATQINIPSFLGYQANIPDDKQVLQNALSTISDKKLHEMIVNILKLNK